MDTSRTPTRWARHAARAALGLLVLASFTGAHDLWLLPPDATATVGQPCALPIAVGMDFPLSTHAIDPERVTAAAHGPDGPRLPASVAREGDADSGTTRVGFTPSASGSWLVALETAARQLDLEAEEFNAYLLEDGMPQVLAARLAREEGTRPARERYSKFAKALFAVGAPAGDAATRPVGARLEIVPERDPAGVRPGEVLALGVLFDGAPLPGSWLCWDEPGNGAAFTGMALTDASGRALVPIGSSGLKTLRLVHMTRPLTDDYEWESFWASLTFMVP